MTRDEFMEHARKEIDQAFQGQKNRMMNLVAQAWAEGKRNAENEHIDELGKDLLESLKKKLELDKSNNIAITTPDIPLVKGPYRGESITWAGDIPKACRNCPNHPSNGGSGICHCILGTEPVTCGTISASNGLQVNGVEVLDSHEQEVSNTSQA